MIVKIFRSLIKLQVIIAGTVVQLTPYMHKTRYASSYNSKIKDFLPKICLMCGTELIEKENHFYSCD